jgi:D-psicose/D-tagatose/L-ribulose 3-epimerase
MEIMDIHTFGGGIYSYWPVDYTKPVDKEGDWARSVSNVRTVGKIAGECGVDYCLEVLNRFEGYLLNTCEECVKFVDEVGTDAVKVMLDTFHMNIEETDIADAIRTAGNLLGHFHTGECNRMVPGRGKIPWREIGAALREIGYNKTVVMEPFVNTGGQVGSDIKIWRELIPGITPEMLDKDAADSLAFQRYMFDGNM